MRKLKKLTNERYIEVSEKIGQLKMLAPDGKIIRAADDGHEAFRIFV